MAVAIKVENLSKAYQLGEIGTGTLASDLERWFARIRGKEDPFLKIGEVNDRTVKGASNVVWSLKDINFSINQGDAVGIIGRNGAGKSTLLKILSRVTTPTSGRIKVKGRIASLLEVGTGFHPELTGRENIYLNGAILGMRKSEISRKFDEIVEFSGVERYIDTPVKRYSSGMYVRLAFAVAANLESEILIIDEVLAVGDAEFQQKCLGKMGEVSKGEGRTVLFVSHNMGAIKKLCDSAIVLDKGSVSMFGGISNSISHYLLLQKKDESTIGFDEIMAAEQDDVVKFNSINLFQEKIAVTTLHSDIDSCLEIMYTIRQRVFGFRLFIYLFDKYETLITQVFFDEESHSGSLMEPGDYITNFTIPKDLLIEGQYTIKIFSGLHDVRMCKPQSGIYVKLNVLETGVIRRKIFPEEFRGLITLPITASTSRLNQ